MLETDDTELAVRATTVRGNNSSNLASLQDLA
jgi:hypothetical protein